MDTTIDCPVSTTLELIGGKYKALILWHLVDNTLRFSEFRKKISNATAKMLTQQLRELEQEELIIRKVYPIVPPKTEYSLTLKGKSIQPILELMYDWGINEMKKNGKTPNCSMKS